MKKNSQVGPKGVGGWLLVPLMGLVMDLAGLGATLVRQVYRVFTVDKNCASDELIVLAGTLFFVLLIASPIVWLLKLSYRRSRRFPEWMGRLMLLMAAVGGVGVLGQLIAVAFRHKEAMSYEMVMPFLCATVWLLYFKYSKRVRNTYTQP